MPDPSQFNTDRTYLGRWTITFSNPPIKLRSGGRTTMTRTRSPTDRRLDF
jgi:hypothetical protein